MSSRDDISVMWSLSPRIVRIAAPSLNVTIQDLHDTLRDIEDEPNAMQYSDLISTAGKEDLGSGVQVGITSTLKNARLSFDARKTSITNGTITTNDFSGLMLHDSTATFISDGIQPGSWIVNCTDGSVCTVISLISETQIRTDILGDGSDNQFEIGDLYKIWPVIQLSVDGGNLVAVDENDAQIDPILPTAGSQVVRSSSSSATLRGLDTFQATLDNIVKATVAATGSILNYAPSLIETNIMVSTQQFNGMLLMINNTISGSQTRVVDTYITGTFSVDPPFTIGSPLDDVFVITTQFVSSRGSIG